MDNKFFKKPILKDLFTILLQNKANKWNIIENKTVREKELVSCLYDCRTNRPILIRGGFIFAGGDFFHFYCL